MKGTILLIILIIAIVSRSITNNCEIAYVVMLVYALVNSAWSLVQEYSE